MKRTLAFWCFLFVLVAASAQRLPDLYQLDGKKAYFSTSNYRATVFILLSPECPLCQGYSATLRDLYKEYKPKQIQFIGIIPGTYFTKKMIENYVTTYHIPFPVYQDRELKVVSYFAATVTPEVFVIRGTAGKIVYAGRIDNWSYAPGKKRTVITEHDLADALKDISEGKTIRKAKTKAIGCFIE